MSTHVLPAFEESLNALCAVIAANPEVQAARESAEAFLADEDAVSLYRELMNTGRDLERRHRSGQAISADEVEAFTDLQEQADGHDGIRSFNEAQEVLQQIANTVNGFVSKTLETGKVPSHEEVLGGGGCGEGCGCHH